MNRFNSGQLTYDPIHRYIPFCSPISGNADEVFESQIIEHPWVQRLRQIHQLQTARYVFPSGEHTRFQHVVGAMHMASVVVERLYDSLRETCPDVPNRAYVESLMRMAGLLHDVGHGPFGHFFDEHFLRDHGLTHETVGGAIIREDLADLIRAIRRNPHGELAPNEQLEPADVAWLIARPNNGGDNQRPLWLCLLRSLMCGVYTIDNMDFVLRDAYMTGYSQRSFDLDRLLHYSFFSSSGLTLHDRGMESLMRFLGARAELFRAIYFHREVRAIDLTLADLFADSKSFLFPGNPLSSRDAYLRFTDWSLLLEVSNWRNSQEPVKKALGERWRAFLDQDVDWKMACERNLVFGESDAEASSIFSDSSVVEVSLRRKLPPELQDMPLRIDITRHVHRPHTRGPAGGHNFLYDSARGIIRPLSDHQLFEQLPTTHRICRVYTHTSEHVDSFAAALDSLIGPGQWDDVTNM